MGCFHLIAKVLGALEDIGTGLAGGRGGGEGVAEVMMVLDEDWEQIGQEVDGNPFIKWRVDFAGCFQGTVIVEAEGYVVDSVPGEIAGDGGAAHFLAI